MTKTTAVACLSILILLFHGCNERNVTSWEIVTERHRKQAEDALARLDRDTDRNYHLLEMVISSDRKAMLVYLKDDKSAILEFKLFLEDHFHRYYSGSLTDHTWGEHEDAVGPLHPFMGNQTLTIVIDENIGVHAFENDTTTGTCKNLEP